jgi:hypothetical protein
MGLTEIEFDDEGIHCRKVKNLQQSQEMICYMQYKQPFHNEFHFCWTAQDALNEDNLQLGDD